MKVIVAVVNNPTFIEIQYHTLKKYLQGIDTFEFIVFNDAKPFPDLTNGGDLTLIAKIAETCKTLNIQCIPIRNNHHGPLGMSDRHADTFNNYIVPYQLANPDQYLLLDSDMFLIDYLDMQKYFKYDCAVVLQSREDRKLNYIWPGLCYLDFTRMKAPNLFNWALCHNGDTGAMTSIWLKEQIGEDSMPDTNDLRWKKNETFHSKTIYFIKHLWSTTWNETEMPANLKDNEALLDFCQKDLRNSNGKFYCEIYDDVFFHYRAGSNHNKEGMNLHIAMTKNLKQILM